MDYLIKGTSRVANDPSKDGGNSSDIQRKVFRERRKNTRDRRKSVRDGVYVTLSSKRDRRISPDRRILSHRYFPPK